MNSLKQFCLTLIVAVAIGTTIRADDEDAPKAQPPAASPADMIATDSDNQPQLAWVEGLQEGQRQALLNRRPILVRVGGTGCRFCKMLEQEIAKPEVQEALNGWTLVYVSIDKDPDVARHLGVTGIPALRVQTVTALPVAEHDGILSAEQLIQWLETNLQLARATPDDVLLGSDVPTAIDMIKLIRQFSNRNPAVREAAIGRLRPHAQLAAGSVVRKFERGDLATRLTALELLREWQAPIEGVDPWRVDTLTEDKLTALVAWASGLTEDPSPANGNAGKQAKLTEEQWAEVHDQLDRMLKAEPQDATAIRDRLARLGEQIREEVLARLRNAETDEAYHRLLTLRYRLAATDSLVLRWPGGLERLAATDNRERHTAAEQLVAQATDADQRLLEDLFGDPDPLVREISLRGLQQLGSTSAQESMIRLLDDPEPNVRAAVLKQFAEDPPSKLVPRIAEYVAEEGDADLVVHAIRFFRQAKGKEALESLLSLLDHESWRVRAEAAQGVGELNDSDLPEKVRMQAYASLIELLDDEDGFVVSRAIKGLKRAEMPGVVQPLVKAADRHPELIVDVIALLSRRSLRQTAESHLRKFAQHERPEVRAGAVEGLSAALGQAATDVVQDALNDEHADVRIVGAEAVYQMMDSLRPDEDDLLGPTQIQRELSIGRSIDPTPRSVGKWFFDLFTKGNKPAPKPVAVLVLEQVEAPKDVTGEDADAAEGAIDSAVDEIELEVATDPVSSSQELAQPDNPWDNWLTEFYGTEPGMSPKGLPKWVEPMFEPLGRMLTASNPHERCAAAVALTAIGRGEQGVPVCVQAANDDPSTIQNAAQALKWLTWDKRIPFFEQLMQAAVSDDHRVRIIQLMRETPDARAIPRYWEMLADPDVGLRVAKALQRAIISGYSGHSRRDLTEANAAVRKEALRTTNALATSGPELQRVAAMGILTYLDREDSERAAQANLNDPLASDQLRADSFQVLLTVSPKAQMQQLAIESLAGDEPLQRALALRLLIHEGRRLYGLRGFSVEISSHANRGYSPRGGRQTITAPKGLKVSIVRPLLDDSDPEVVAQAAYLLALIGDGTGLPRLISHWRASHQNDQQWTIMVYRAIAVLDDSRQLPVLQEIYQQLDRHEMRDFYWTIRIMTGPEMLRFRKQIRETVGMENLQ